MQEINKEFWQEIENKYCNKGISTKQQLNEVYMDGYTILYDGNGVTFGGAWLDDYSAVVFKVQIWEKSTSGLDVGYSAAGYFSLLDTSKYCKQLQRMYETLSGECVIEDCDWDDGNSKM